MSDTPVALTDEQVAAIRARLDARTPGQWLHRTGAPYGYVAKCGDSADASEYVTPRDLDWPANGAHHDAEFIAHAPDDIAALLTDRDRLARRVEELEAAERKLKEITALMSERHYQGAPFDRGCLDPTVAMVSSRWYARLKAAARPTTEETPSPSPAQETP